MQQVTDWITLWRELADMQLTAWEKPHRDPKPDLKDDAWVDRARQYDEGVKRRWAKPDSSRDLVVSLLKAHPEWTALDIGGGTGAWAVLMAQHARAVTVVEPSAAMREVLLENVAQQDLHNITVVAGKWPDAQVTPHDLVFCAHALYGMRDFTLLVRTLESVSRRLVVLLMRAPLPDGLMAQMATRVWGQPYDSPNFQVAYNALLQMGIFPNVHMEDSGLWRPWTNATLDEALAEVKRKLGLSGPSEHDAYIRDMLERNLTLQDGKYVWPRGVRSAMMYWDVTQGGSRTPLE